MGRAKYVVELAEEERVRLRSLLLDADQRVRPDDCGRATAGGSLWNEGTAETGTATEARGKQEGAWHAVEGR